MTKAYYCNAPLFIFEAIRKLNAMKPIPFKQSNKTLGRPNALTDLECGSLEVWTDNRQCVSCWKPSFRERISILLFGKVWLGVFSGETQPPVFIEAKRSAFERKGFRYYFENCCSRIFKS